jgi:Flp pilus assembly protein TadG
MGDAALEPPGDVTTTSTWQTSVVGSVAVAHEVADDAAGTVAVSWSSETTWNAEAGTDPKSIPVAESKSEP